MHKFALLLLPFAASAAHLQPPNTPVFIRPTPVPVVPMTHLTWVRFDCIYTPANTWDSCYGPLNGMCPEGFLCLARMDPITKTLFGPTCCDNGSTPVHQIRNAYTNGTPDWEVYIDLDPAGEGPDKGKSHVLGCEKPFYPVSCFGGAGRCCPEDKSQCGIFRDRDEGCCGPHTSELWKARTQIHTECCTAGRGGFCTWARLDWPFLQVPSQRACCLGFDRNCGPGCGLTSAMLSLSVLANLVACFWGKAWKYGFLSGRVVRQLFSRLLLGSLVHFLVAVSAGHTTEEAIVWTLASGTFLVLVRVLRQLWASRSRRAEAPAVLPERPRQPLRLAILIDLQSYPERLGAREDKAMDALEERLLEVGWKVLRYRNRRYADFDTLAHDVAMAIEGTEDAHVLLYISCHAMMVNGMHCILPIDVGRLNFYYLPVWDLLEDMNTDLARRTNFTVFINGCSSPAGCLHKLWWQLRYCGRGTDVRVNSVTFPRSGEAHFSIFFASDPGRAAYGDRLTTALVRALEEPQRRLPEIYEEVRETLQHPPRTEDPREQEPVQTPWLLTSAPSNVVLNHLAPNEGGAQQPAGAANGDAANAVARFHIDPAPAAP